jgi:hypothetical protein
LAVYEEITISWPLSQSDFQFIIFAGRYFIYGHFLTESREQIEELHRKLMEAKRVRLDLENTTDITVRKSI